jgi:hypothetical protein
MSHLEVPEPIRHLKPFYASITIAGKQLPNVSMETREPVCLRRCARKGFIVNLAAE